MTYLYEPRGVFIQGVSGTLYEISTWNDQETPNGVAVCTDNCQFVMALSYISGKIYGGYGEVIQGVGNGNAYDYNGYENTNKLIESSLSFPAAETCADYTFPNGQKGYLGASGEWEEYSNNRFEVDSAFSAIGVSLRLTSFKTEILTSTQYGANYCYYINTYQGIVTYTDRSTTYEVLPFTTL